MTFSDQCDGCEYNYFKTIADFYENDDKSILFLRSHGVLPSTVICPNCGSACLYREDQKLWCCTHAYYLPKTRKRRYCNFSVADIEGSLLDKALIPPWKIILFVNHFISHLWDYKTVINCLDISTSTSVDWWSICCQVTDGWVASQDPIGGKGVEVEIDETLILRRVFEKGRVHSQIWLFGGIERMNKRRFIVPLINSAGEEQDKESLLLLIKKYIKLGTIIYSKSRPAYQELNALGYKHFVVDAGNINRNKACHVQTIERVWRDLKEWTKKPGIFAHSLNQYLSRYLFLTSNGDNKTLLHKFFCEAGKLYPPHSECHPSDIVEVVHAESLNEEESFLL